MGLKDGVFQRFAAHMVGTTLHGVNHFAAAQDGRRWHLRLTWLGIFLGMLAWCIYSLSAGILQYYEFKTTSTWEYYTVKEMEIPSMTLCSVNQFRKPFMQKLFESGRVPIELLYVIGNFSGINASDYEENMSKKLDSIDMTALAVQAAYQLDETTLIQHWMSEPFKSADFFQNGFRQWGYCHTLYPVNYKDKHGPVLLKSNGVWNYMIIDMKEIDDYVTGFQDHGLYVTIHTPSEEPLPYEYGVFVQNGKIATMNVVRRDIFNLPPPYSDCVNTKVEGFVNPLKRFAHYSFSACTAECKTDAYEEHCGCVPYKQQYVVGAYIPVCKLSQSECKPPGNFFAECHGKCKQPCEYTEYSFTMESRDWVTKSMKKRKVNGSIENWYKYELENLPQENYINLIVQFKSLGYTSISQHAAYPGSALFGNIGGMMGLCLGASILTVVEILEFWLRECLRRLMNCVTGSKEQQEGNEPGATDVVQQENRQFLVIIIEDNNGLRII